MDENSNNICDSYDQQTQNQVNITEINELRRTVQFQATLIDVILDNAKIYVWGWSYTNGIAIENIRLFPNGHIIIDYSNPNATIKLKETYIDDLNDGQPSATYPNPLISCLSTELQKTIGTERKSLDLTESCGVNNLELNHIVRVCIVTEDIRNGCLLEKVKNS